MVYSLLSEDLILTKHVTVQNLQKLKYLTKMILSNNDFVLLHHQNIGQSFQILYEHFKLLNLLKCLTTLLFLKMNGHPARLAEILQNA